MFPLMLIRFIILQEYFRGGRRWKRGLFDKGEETGTWTFYVERVECVSNVCRIDHLNSV